MKVEINNLDASLFKILASNHRVGVSLSVKGNILTDEPNEFTVGSAHHVPQQFISIDFALNAYNKNRRRVK